MRSATGWLFLTPIRYRKEIQRKTPQSERKPHISWDSICITHRKGIQIKTPQSERKPRISWDSICITHRKGIQIKTPQLERKPRISWDSICITYRERIYFILIKRNTITLSCHLSTSHISCAIRLEFKSSPLYQIKSSQFQCPINPILRYTAMAKIPSTPASSNTLHSLRSNSQLGRWPPLPPI